MKTETFDVVRFLVLVLLQAAFVLPPSILTAQPSQQTPPQESAYKYKLIRDGSTIGDGYIAVVPEDGRTTVYYRIDISVDLMFVEVFSLEREQYAVFGSDGNILYARSWSERNNDSNRVEVCADGGDKIRLQHAGQERTIPRTDFVMTTLHPVFVVPKDGTWLDLAHAKLEQYKITEPEEHTYFLSHRGETDRIVKDPQGVVKTLRLETSKGSVILERSEKVEVSTVREGFDQAFSLHEVERSAQQCLKQSHLQ